MTFLNPGFLPFFALAAIPIIIHLLNRLRYKRVQWAAMEFLLASRKETIKRSRLKNFLLLASRVLGVALLVAAVARPVATGGLLASMFVGGSGQRLILVDNSLSMNFVSRGESSADRARECLDIILDASRGGDRVAFAAALQPGGDTVYSPADEATPQALDASIARTDAALDVRSVLKSAAREIELRGGGTAEVVLITDMQESNWGAEDVTAWEDVRQVLLALGEGFSLRVIDVGTRQWENTAVTDLSVADAVLVPGRRTSVRVGLGRSANAPESCVVSFYAGEERQSTTEIEWQGDDIVASCAFEMEVPEAPRAGRVEIGDDKLTADNARYFVIDPCREIPVLCLDGRPGQGVLGGGRADSSRPRSARRRAPSGCRIRCDAW